MSWKTPSRGDSQLTVLALPSNVKAQLIQRKALTRQSVTSQIVEALQHRWNGTAASPTGSPGTSYRQPPPGVPTPVGGYRGPAVVQNPATTAVGDLITSGRYAGMRRQSVGLNQVTGKFDPNAEPFV
jgi:hypothetical protein